MQSCSMRKSVADSIQNLHPSVEQVLGQAFDKKLQDKNLSRGPALVEVFLATTSNALRAREKGFEPASPELVPVLV